MKGNKRNKLRERRKELAFRKKQHKKSKVDTCINCGSHNNITKHHVKFKMSGGKDINCNYQMLCWKCHKKYHQIVKNIFEASA